MDPEIDQEIDHGVRPYDPVIPVPNTNYPDLFNWYRGFSDGCAFMPCAEPMSFMYRAGHAYGLADAIATYGPQED